MFYKVFIIKAQPANAQSLAEYYRSCGVVWMSRPVIKILMAISNNPTVFNINFQVKKCNAFFA